MLLAKKDKTGADLAQVITDTSTADIEKLTVSLKQLLESWLKPEALKNSEVNSMALIMFTSYVPNTVELFS